MQTSANVSTVDIAKFHQYKAKGLLKKQAHPTLPLLIWNYSELTQFSKQWDEVTLLARALITDVSGKIVARSFPKFFNMGERENEEITSQFVIQDKMDGSLGIMFWYEDRWRIASRGSFTSDQACKAQQLLDAKYDVHSLDPTLGYSVEIIYPANRIVVNYHTREELVFLAAFHPDGTESFPDMTKSGLSQVKQYKFEDFRVIRDLDWDNAEGFVVRFSNGFRLKLKFEGYLKLHRVITNLSNLAVWEWYATGKPIQDFIADVPDEFMGFVQKCWNSFVNDASKIAADTQHTFTELQVQALDRKTFALKVKDEKYKKILFAMLDNKPVFDLTAKQLRPTTKIMLDNAACHE